ncbi:MAG TPA: transcription antitermination factor NusB, partial [Actinomycetes bacterium]|nr:transcription antitermination factor NusB [Actinomycetes bacterium]
AVVIDEAVTLARSLSTDESPAFVNGLLGRLLDLKPELTAEPETEPTEPSEPTEPTGPTGPTEELMSESVPPAGTPGPR